MLRAPSATAGSIRPRDSLRRPARPRLLDSGALGALTLASIPCAVIPILGFLWLMWWLDRYDREPLWLFLGVFLWGAVGAIILAVIGSGVLSVPIAAIAAQDVQASLTMTFVAPLAEEPSKALILFLVARSRHFDNVTDGFVYGAAAGLGFGMSENLMYFVNVASTGDPMAWAATVVIRTLYSALMHGAATSLVGAAIGLAQFRRGIARPALLTAGFAGAIAMHALWNGLLALADAGAPLLGVLDMLLFPLQFGVLVLIFQAVLLAEHKMILRELTLEADEGHIPRSHVPFLSSYLKRTRRGWLPPGIDHHEYVRLATTLALRREQRDRGTEQTFSQQEIVRIRAEIATLLGDWKGAGVGA